MTAREAGLGEVVGKRFKPYPDYKETGLCWLGKIPAHWENQRLKFMAKVIMGQSPPSEEYNMDGVGLPFLQGNAEFGPLFPSPQYFFPNASKTVPKGALLFSVRAPVGASNMADQKYSIGRGLCGIIPNLNVLIPNFAWYALHVSRTELIALATGSTYDAVSVDEVENVFFILPKLKEQWAIANFLDWETVRIDELIAKKQRLIELLQEKRTVLISQAVTKGLNPYAPMKDSGIEWLGKIPQHWEVSKICFTATVKARLGWKGLKAEEYVDEGFVFLSTPNIKNYREIDFINVKGTSKNP